MENKTKDNPSCVGMILDGNRRWAKENNLPAFEGHNEGYENLKRCVEWAKEAGINSLIVYAFSTENWNRTEDEVSMLTKLFERMVIKEAEELKSKEVKILFVGQKERFSERLREGMNKLEKDTTHFMGLTLSVCVSYGGRAEILSAVKNIVSDKSEKEVSNITEDEFSEYLWTKNIPDPDLIIRTGGDKRLSNFLPWQSVYSELFFVETKWPAFSKNEFLDILDEYKKREQRKGR